MMTRLVCLYLFNYMLIRLGSTQHFETEDHVAVPVTDNCYTTWRASEFKLKLWRSFQRFPGARHAHFAYFNFHDCLQRCVDEDLYRIGLRLSIQRHGGRKTYHLYCECGDREASVDLSSVTSNCPYHCSTASSAQEEWCMQIYPRTKDVIRIYDILPKFTTTTHKSTRVTRPTTTKTTTATSTTTKTTTATSTIIAKTTTTLKPTTLSSTGPTTELPAGETSPLTRTLKDKHVTAAASSINPAHAQNQSYKKSIIPAVVMVVLVLAAAVTGCVLLYVKRKSRRPDNDSTEGFYMNASPPLVAIVTPFPRVSMDTDHLYETVPEPEVRGTRQKKTVKRRISSGVYTVENVVYTTRESVDGHVSLVENDVYT